MSAAHPILKRDADGLMLEQRKVLQAIAGGVEPHAACRQEDVTWSRFRRWIEKDPAFLEKYNSLFGSTPEVAKSMLDMMAVKAVNVVDESLSATRLQAVEATCEECNHVTTVYVDVADWQKQKWAAEYVGKASEVLKDVRKTDVNVVHSIDSAQLERAIALQRAKRGMGGVAPHLLEEFRKQGLLGPGGEDDVVEGEFREVPAEEAAT